MLDAVENDGTRKAHTIVPDRWFKNSGWKQIKNTRPDLFFPQHIVEGLLNSRRRVSDRPGWILISKTPARKSTDIIVFFLPQKRIKGCKEEILTEMPYSLLYCKLRPLGSALQLSEASRLRTRMRQSPK